MSYKVTLYRREVKEKQLQSEDKDFFEKESNLLAFTKEQKEKLEARLLKYNYIIEQTDKYGIHFSFEDNNRTSALLGNTALYFSSTGDDIFDISMTASEFTDSAEFSKYDPQAGGWEDTDS